MGEGCVLEPLAVGRDGHVAEVTLTGTVMGPDFWRELPRVFAALDRDADVRAVVLRGAGRNFSYGLDLRAMREAWGYVLERGARAEARTRFLEEIRALQSAVGAIADCRKPVIAVVGGWCVGGAMDLIAAADIRLASAEAKFSVRQTTLGIVPDLGSLQRLAGIIGEGHLRELAFTGQDIDAARAERIGLVNEIHPHVDAAVAAARELARRIAENPPLAVQGIKDVMDVERGPRVRAGLRYLAAWNAAFMPSDDLEEAVQAFGEGREARFAGR
jgi:enoyl-CoA hydratase